MASYGVYYPTFQSYSANYARPYPYPSWLNQPTPQYQLPYPRQTWAPPHPSLMATSTFTPSKTPKPASVYSNLLPNLFIEQPKRAFSFIFDQDLWQDTPLRYLGFINELAHAWEPVIQRAATPARAKRIIQGADIWASIYTGINVISEARQALNLASDCSQKAKIAFTSAVAGHILLFHSLASFILPMALVRAVSKFTSFLMPKIPPKAMKSLPLTGQVLIPAIASSLSLLAFDPIDRLTKNFLEKTYWAWLNPKLAAMKAPILAVGHWKKTNQTQTA